MTLPFNRLSLHPVLLPVLITTLLSAGPNASIANTAEIREISPSDGSVSLEPVSTATPTAPPNHANSGLQSADLLAGWQDTDGTRIAAVRVQLAPGWKTYWRVPGEAGIPPVLDFSASRNVASFDIIWPTPRAFDQNGMRSIGYLNQMVLPVKLRAEDPSQPITLAVTLDIGICHDICVPVSVSLAADLPAPDQQPDQPSPNINPVITAALANVPVPRPGIATCQTEPVTDGTRVTAHIDLPKDGDQVALFELASTPMWVSESVAQRTGDILVASADFVPDDAAPFDVDTNDLRITVLGQHGATETDGCVTAP